MIKFITTIAVVSAFLIAVVSADARTTVFRGHDACHIAVPETTPESFYLGDVIEIFRGNTERLICRAHLVGGPGVDDVTVIVKSVPGTTCKDTLFPSGRAIERCLTIF